MNELECNPNFDVNEKYLVENQHIKLSITVGNGKVESHEVSMNSDTLLIGDNVNNFKIDLDTEIESKTLFITSYIVKSPNSDLATITYTLSGGGVESKDFPETKEFNGQTKVCIAARFKFK